MRTEIHARFAALDPTTLPKHTIYLRIMIDGAGSPPFFFFSSRRRHTRFDCDWSSDVCSSDLLLCLLHPLRVSHRNAWLQQMALAAVLYALLPLLNLLTGGASLVQTLANGQWSIASFELLMLGLAAIHGVVAWWLLRGKPAAAAVPAVARTQARAASHARSEEHTSELQSQSNLVCRLLLEKKKITYTQYGL